MYIQLKKVVIIIIFLISVIIMLGYQNYKLTTDSYNILLVSKEEDIVTESLTKNIWEDIVSLSSSITLNNFRLNYKYLEIKNSTNFENYINENIKTNKLIVIVGDTYNDVLEEVIQENPNTKFVLIENSLEIEQKNTYKINIEWEDIYMHIKTYLENEIERLRGENILGKKEKLNVYFIPDPENLQRIKEVKEYLEDLDINFIVMNEDKINSTNLLEEYNKNKEVYIINLSMTNQTTIIKQVVKAQKTNIYDYYEDITTKEPVSYPEKENTKNKKKEEELKYIPIHYIGTYEGDIEIGTYDNPLTDNIIEENILVDKFELDYKKNLKDIILESSQNKNYSLKTSNKTLKIDKI